jgi:hypothetical protein
MSLAACQACFGKSIPAATSSLRFKMLPIAQKMLPPNSNCASPDLWEPREATPQEHPASIICHAPLFLLELAGIVCYLVNYCCLLFVFANVCCVCLKFLQAAAFWQISFMQVNAKPLTGIALLALYS